jgi:putative CocE/NonD family hydrolase
MSRKLAALAALAVALPACAAAQQQPFDLRAHYTKLEVMIPMRDGVRLYTRIFVPRDTTSAHPIVMVRTPYANFPYGPDAFPAPDHITARYARENFILVGQDVRGRWMSEGEFVDVRPVIEHKTSNRDIDEPSDTYDTIDWLIKNVPHNNGRVGVRGTSYPGFYAEMAALSGHPALKVVSPQAPVTEWMGGDDFFHNGALLEPHFLDFSYGFGRPRPHPTSDRATGAPTFDHGTPDGYTYYLRLGALSNVNPRVYHDSVAFWDSIVAHPMWDAFWAARSGRPHLHDIKPAVLWVGGWFDTENLWGALHAYAAAVAQSPASDDRLVMGPWYHSQWNTPRGDSLGLIAWGMPTTDYFADSIEVPFFDAFLLDDQPAPRKFAAAVFETGRDAWHYLDAWPPAGAAPTSFYLADSGRLSMTRPAGEGVGFDQYVSDPAKPVPYTDEITHWYDPAFMLGDQRFASRRPDVLVYRTEPLGADLTVAGPIDVDLVVSTTGTDQDFIVKVVDVYPDTAGRGAVPSFSYSRARRGSALGGYEMLIRGDVVRGKYRRDPEHPSHPEPFRPGVPTEVRFRMNDVYHTFLAGHRLMVQVQSTWFPMIDRNPGVFEDIFTAQDADFRATTQRIYRSAAHASRVILPVLR